MKIGVIGSGNIGGNLTRRLTSIGHQVRVANSRGPHTLAGIADETGAVPVDVGDVAAGVDVLIVAIPEKAVPQLPAAVLDGLADGAAVIDTGNYYPQRDGRIADIENGMPESKWVQQQLGHPVVKAFNGVHAAAIIERAQPTGSPGRLAVAIASDDSVAKATVMRLIDELGFDSVDAGGIDESWRMQPGTPWYGQGFDADGVREALAEAQPERPAELRA